MYVAATNGHAHCVRALASKGADVNKATNNGKVPFGYAMARSFSGADLDCLEALLEAGANINAAGQDGKTFLHMAQTAEKFSFQPHVIEILRKHGVNI